MNRSSVAIALAVLAGATGVAPGRVWAQEPAVPTPAEPAATMSPAQLLAAADAAIEAGNLDGAAVLYDQVARQHPEAPEASEARRALKIIAARRTQLPAAAVPAGSSSEGTTGVVTRREP
jgi:outer membrane protein assembly factor BamD (BamD/ComL family)